MNILMNLDEVELASLKLKFEQHPDKKLPRFNVRFVHVYIFQRITNPNNIVCLYDEKVF